MSAIPDATRGGQANTAVQESHTRSGADARETKTYPQGTFEALLVVAVNRRKNLQELLNALLVVEVGHLFEGLLNQLAESFGLRRRRKCGERNLKKNCIC